MISLDLLTGATGNATGAHGGQVESNSNSWLFELERAWLNAEKGMNNAPRAGADSRAESSPDGDEGYSGGKAETALHEMASAASGSSAMLALSGITALASVRQFDSAPAAFTSLRQAMEVSLPASQPLVEGKTADIFAGTTPMESGRPDAQEQSSLGATGKENPGAPRSPAESDAAYPEKRLHLFEDEHGVRVWIRDAALSEGRGYAIANALRNELGAAGLRVVAVALNGKEVTSDSSPSPEPGMAPEQDSGYARSMIDESNPSIEKHSLKEHS